jgi:hypothetical protein
MTRTEFWNLVVHGDASFFVGKQIMWEVSPLCQS